MNILEKFFLNYKRKINLSFSLLSVEHKKKFIKFYFLILIGVILETLSISSVLPFAEALVEKKSFILDYFFSYFPNSQNIEKKNLIIYLLASIILIFSLKNIYLFYLSKKQTDLILSVQKDIQYSLYSKYINQSVNFLSKRNSSNLIQNIVNNTGVYCEQFLNSIFVLSIEAIVMVVVLILLFSVNFQGTLLFVSIFGLVGSIVFLSKQKLLSKLGKLKNLYTISLIKNIQQSFNGIREIKVYGKENFFKKNKIKNLINLKNIGLDSTVISIFPKHIFEITSILVLSLIIVFTMNEKTETFISPFVFLFIAAAYRLLPSINRFIIFGNKIKFSLPIVKIIIKEINLLKNNNKNFVDKNNKKNFKFKNEIIFKNIGYKYFEAKKKCFSGVNLKIKSKSMIGIVGRSGVGKTTLFDLLLGLKIPTEGKIYIDGIDLKKITKPWQKNIGFVSQDVFLLDDTLKKNIAFGEKKENINLRRIHKVIKQTKLSQLVKDLPFGLETYTGERGTRISGGQKQRIGIARALYFNPNILILDEATSSLDYKTENEIINELASLKGNITIIFITHRLNTLKNCDTTYELNKNSLKKIKV